MCSWVGQWGWKSWRNVGQVGYQAVHLEITQRERKAVMDAAQRGDVLGQPLDQPFGDTVPSPIFNAGKAAATLRPEVDRPQPDRRAIPSGSRSVSSHPSSRYRYIEKKPSLYLGRR